jgi:hypothetical protein
MVCQRVIPACNPPRGLTPPCRGSRGTAAVLRSRQSMDEALLDQLLREAKATILTTSERSRL